MMFNLTDLQHWCLMFCFWEKIYFEVGNLIAEREIPMPGWQKIPTLEFYRRH